MVDADADVVDAVADNAVADTGVVDTAVMHTGAGAKAPAAGMAAGRVPPFASALGRAAGAGGSAAGMLCDTAAMSVPAPAPAAPGAGPEEVRERACCCRTSSSSCRSLSRFRRRYLPSRVERLWVSLQGLVWRVGRVPLSAFALSHVGKSHDELPCHIKACRM